MTEPHLSAADGAPGACLAGLAVSAAVASRRSVRRFLDKPVDAAVLRDVLSRAARAPSGGNLQPWHIEVVMGAKLTALKVLMARRVAEAPRGEGTEYDIYPDPMSEADRQRTFEVGQRMYEVLGIARDDKAGRAQWFARNFQCFGATAALFCHVERHHGPPQWADLGMYLQTVMLLLREAGLDSCAQECWAMYHRTVDAFLGVPSTRLLFAGMAIGWADPDAPENAVQMPRVPLDAFARFHTDEPTPGTTP